jgi:N-glycosylase/DNA lyase
MILPLDGSLDLEATLLCGQAFRWRRAGDAFFGVIEGHGVRLREEGNALRIRSSMDEARLRRWAIRYFDLDRDVEGIRRTLARDPVLRPALRVHSGLRVLRQEPWEVLISFILSQNANIPRIRGMVRSLCEECGKVRSFETETFHSFPGPGELIQASVGELRGMGLGYRAEFVSLTAEMISVGDPDLKDIETLDLEAARDVLLRLPGVGPKVADCVLLYGFHRLEAFPLDVWTKRVLEHLYFGGQGTPHRALQGFVKDRFGGLAGYAQLFMFAHARVLWKEICGNGA